MAISRKKKLPEQLSSIMLGACIGSVVVIALYSLVFDPQFASASINVPKESSNPDQDEKSIQQTSARASSQIDSVADLFTNYTDSISRMGAAYDLIGEADETSLIELFDEVIARRYTEEDSPWKYELISLISARLAPKNLDKTVSLYKSLPLDDSKYMLYGLMHSWASKDFNGAAKFARQQKKSVQSIALRGIVDANIGLPEKTLLDLGKELGDVQFVKRALAAYQLALDQMDPDQAWTTVINDPTFHREENFDRAIKIANAMIDKHGVTEFDDLLSSITSPTLSYTLRKNMLARIAFSDPETAFNLALETPYDRFGSMQKAVIDTWVTSDPQNALLRVRSLEPSKVRDRLQENIIVKWIQQDLGQFVSSLSNIPVELRDTARLTIIEHVVNDSIEDALAVLPDITANTSRETAAQTIVKSWIQADHEAAFQWIVSNSEIEAYRTRLLVSFMEQLSDEDANKAFDLALSYPIQDDELGLEAIVIENIKVKSIEDALRLLSKVRAGSTKLAAFEAVSTALIYKKRTDEAIELGNSLTEKEQVSFYNNLAFSLTTQETPSKILEILPKVPVKEAQSKIAENALMFQRFSADQELFSDEQVKTLMGYLEPDVLNRTQRLLER